ncbi:synembryn-A-like isoform X2 [Coregonus clupeaformis]|uniref:synembryn-A-like isoform X2 n=1 Tax=Coregonus clupeaformis TaxID=59861 RepID=UPI001E1C5C71|nr:synembryn-A-like isoform X2 [Coregonus clupeaformis]
MVCVCVCESMDMDLERIIQCIKQGDQVSVQTHLDHYNTQYAECFFFNIEERERRKFRKNKMRDFVPDSDPDFNSDSDDAEDPDLLLRRRLAAALVWFIRTQLQPGVLRVTLRTLRILSRDRQALAPLVTDTALLTLAHLGGITSLPIPEGQEEDEEEGHDAEREDYGHVLSDVSSDACKQSDTGGCSRGANANTSSLAVSNVDANVVGASPTQHSLAQASTQTCPALVTANNSQGGAMTLPSVARDPCCTLSTETCHGNLRSVSTETCTAQHHCSPGHAREERDEERDEEVDEEEKEEDDQEGRREALKALCNIIYNSQRAQERVSALRLLYGLSDRLKQGISAKALHSGQFYELRLLFLLTALRPELRVQLQQERGVSMLTAALEQCLSVQWGEEYEVLSDHRAPPVSKEVSQRAVEILKTLFNITYSFHRQEPDEEDAALYRRLAAVLRHCLLLTCDGEELTEELQGHTVNVLSALPLQCLDVLLSVHLTESSQEWEGVNMDTVHTLLTFMERRLDRGQKLKEKLTPVLNLLTESCRAHRETRHYLRQQILPPLRDVVLRPEQGATVRGRLVRLMTHVDTDIKHCAAELLFVLCKENVSRFVKYTGYGNAAGLLAARGMLSGGQVTHAQYSSDSDSDTEEYREAKGRINPVTGRVEKEQPDPMEGMTEQEKEQEAQRLISLFNRLSRDKIIQPVGVTTGGRLEPLCGQMRGSTVEEEESEGESEEEREK